MREPLMRRLFTGFQDESIGTLIAFQRCNTEQLKIIGQDLNMLFLLIRQVF